MSREPDDSLDRALAALRPRVPDGFADAVLARTRSGFPIDPPGQRGSRRPLATLLIGVACAAALALAVALRKPDVTAAPAEVAPEPVRSALPQPDMLCCVCEDPARQDPGCVVDTDACGVAVCTPEP